MRSHNREVREQRYVREGTLLFAILIFASTAFPQTDSDDHCTLSITSTPDSAEVFIDGMLRGITPISCGDLDPGSHELEIRKAGYLPFVDTLHFDRPGLFVRDIRLVQTGALRINSEPPGAEILINQAYVGTTPTLVEGLTPEMTSLQLSLPGHSTWNQSVVVQPGKVSDVSVKLFRPVGFLTLETYPHNAEILIDGNNIGRGPLTEYEIPTGRYLIEVKSEGGSSTGYTIFIPPGGFIRLRGYVDDFDPMPLVASAIVPGLGQTIDGATLKGLAILAAFSVATGFTVSQSLTISDKEKEIEALRPSYTLATGENQAFLLSSEMQQLHDEMNAANDKRNLGLLTMAGIYVLSIIDILLNHSTSSGFEPLTFNAGATASPPSVTTGTVQCTVAFHF